MTLNDLAQAEPWMDQEERQITDTLIAAFRQNFAERQIPENPFLTLRLQNCLVQYILCRRLERSLTAGAEDPGTTHTAHVGRARERLRKALKELEDTANKLAPPSEASSNPANTRPRLRTAGACLAVALGRRQVPPAFEPAVINDSDDTPAPKFQNQPSPLTIPIPQATPPASPALRAARPLPPPPPIVRAPGPILAERSHPRK